MIELIKNRLEEYKVNGAIEEENALKEIMQEIMLFSLWRSEFFEVAAFQGGTSLRILHKLPRFSEDMYFILLKPDYTFSWQPYLDNMADTFREFGIEPEVLDKPRMEQRVKRAVLKDSSITNQMNLSFMDDLNGRKLKIKLEVDCDPADGSDFEYSYLDFPIDFEVCHQDISSNFALKIHALLCRGYIKGRDWYDFNWYITHRTTPNLFLLKNALVQYGPWQDQDLNINPEWVVTVLKEKIASVDWQNAVQDVEIFMKTLDQESLKLWSEKFFMKKLQKLYN